MRVDSVAMSSNRTMEPAPSRSEPSTCTTREKYFVPSLDVNVDWKFGTPVGEDDGDDLGQQCAVQLTSS